MISTETMMAIHRFVTEVCVCGHERWSHADRGYDNGDISQVRWVACRDSFKPNRNADCVCLGFVAAAIQPERPPLERPSFLERIAIALEKIADQGSPVVKSSAGAAPATSGRVRANYNGDKCAGCDAVVVKETLRHHPGCTGNF